MAMSAVIQIVVTSVVVFAFAFLGAWLAGRAER